MKNAIRMGMLSAALMLSLGAHAAGIEIKPVEIKPIEVKPMTPVGVQGQGQTGSGLSFGSMTKPKINTNTGTSIPAGAECGAGPLNAGQLYNKVAGIAPDITLDQVQREIRNGDLTRGTCQKPLEALSAEALANAIRIGDEVDRCLSGQNPKGHPKTDECEIKAQKVVGLEGQEAIENAEALKKCGYNGQTLSQSASIN